MRPSTTTTRPANARAYVEAGAGLIVSSWPYTAKPADVAVMIARAEGG